LHQPDERKVSRELTSRRITTTHILVWDFDAELLLDGHDNLYGVEAVETEVLGKAGFCGSLAMRSERSDELTAHRQHLQHIVPASQTLSSQLWLAPTFAGSTFSNDFKTSRILLLMSSLLNAPDDANLSCCNCAAIAGAGAAAGRRIAAMLRLRAAEGRAATTVALRAAAKIAVRIIFGRSRRCRSAAMF
jgi:hypothetical protein